MKIFKIVITVLIGLAFIAGVFFVGVGYGVFYALAPVGGDTPVTVEIAEGDSAQEIGKKLEAAGAIRSALVFRGAVRFGNSDGDFHPGKYTIDPKKSMMEIIIQLKSGAGASRLITIPEGLVLKDIACLLETKDVVSSSHFLQSVGKYSFSVNGKKVENLEGYLLPDTYDFPPEYKADDVIKTLLEAFNSRVLPLYEEKKRSLPVALNLHQVVILASMIEREAQVPSERPIIARVYYNRLKKDMPLQCDATVQYILGKQKENLTYADLKIDSPYNTYLHRGLPPGPIANPGLASIRAALEPSEHDYLFYVRNDVKNDGSHVFTRTYEEHKQAIRQYQK